jgi:hypothetical protein
MNLLEKACGNEFVKTGETKKLSIPGVPNTNYDVYAIPLKYLYYNDQNGRINTTYKKFKAEKEPLTPEMGDSEYNEIFEQFIFESNKQAMKDTLQSIKDKMQQEPGVVLSDGRVIDGNRRFTALRMCQKEDGIPKTFNAVILPLDTKSKADEKTIKKLELDLQLGREERVNYDPIDRIFDVYNTIVVEKLMTAEEYKKASGAGNIKGINRDIRLAELILKFIDIVSPSGNSVDKFYLARDLKLDGPIEEIERAINDLKSQKKASITEAILVHLVVSKIDKEQKDSTRIMRELKTNILKNADVLDHYLPAVDENVDIIMEAFESQPITSSNDIKVVLNQNEEIKEAVEKIKKSTNRLVNKGRIDSKRKKALVELENIRDSLDELRMDDFSELKPDEYLDAKDILIEITDILFKLKKDLNI